MILAITISEALLIQSGVVIFGAGVIVSKVNSITEILKGHIEDHKSHPERIAKIETHLKNISNEKNT